MSDPTVVLSLFTRRAYYRGPGLYGKAKAQMPTIMITAALQSNYIGCNMYALRRRVRYIQTPNVLIF